MVRCFSNVFTNILFASEVPTIPSRYAVNLIKGNREAWMHRIGSLLLRDSMGHHRHAAFCSIPALYHDSCSILHMFFFWQPDGHSGAASNVFIFNWLIQVCFPNFNIFKNSENEFQLPSSASSLAASTKGSTAAPCALRRSFWCVEIQIWKRVPKNRIFLEVERAGEGPGPGRLMLSALLWSKPAVCTGHHYQECYWVVKPHPIHIYCISILYPSISISTLLYSTLLLHSTLFYSILWYLTDLSLTQSLVSFIILYHFENLQSCTATFKCPVMVSERPSIRTWLECWKNSFPRLPRLLRFFVAGIHGTAQLGCSRHQWLRLQGQTFWNEASRSEMDEKIWTIEQIMRKSAWIFWKMKVKTGWNRSMPSMLPPGLGCPGPGRSLNH